MKTKLTLPVDMAIPEAGKLARHSAQKGKHTSAVAPSFNIAAWERINGAAR